MTSVLQGTSTHTLELKADQRGLIGSVVDH